MSKRTSLTFTALPAFCISIPLLVGGNAIAADKSEYEKEKKVVATKVDAMPSVTFLPREISKSLKISRVPTSEPIPLIVGTYWTCDINDQGFEICDTLVVVCTDDQSFCTQIP